MKKNIKFLFILTMFLVLIINTYCFAIDMNLTMNNQAGNNELEVQTNEVNAENNNSEVVKPKEENKQPNLDYDNAVITDEYISQDEYEKWNETQ